MSTYNKKGSEVYGIVDSLHIHEDQMTAQLVVIRRLPMLLNDERYRSDFGHREAFTLSGNGTWKWNRRAFRGLESLQEKIKTCGKKIVVNLKLNGYGNVYEAEFTEYDVVEVKEDNIFHGDLFKKAENVK